MGMSRVIEFGWKLDRQKMEISNGNLRVEIRKANEWT
jgi:hypothetical protein